MVNWLKRFGNALKFLYGQCISPQSQADDQELGHHGVSSSTVGVSVLAQHLYDFEITFQVPEGLSQHVISSKKAQSNWYKKLSKAWRESKQPPTTPEEASRLIIYILRRHQRPDVEGLLSFYGLPLPHSVIELQSGTEVPSLADGPKFELNTLPVEEWAVPDGDGVNVYISTSDPRESSRVPQEVQMAAVERSEARAKRNYKRADALRKQIIDAGYQVIHVNNEEILARKYRIRLRGIDAPENGMPYGKEAKDELVKLIKGKRLKILIFDEDKYGRFVGDVYCNGIFVQKIMLKKGLAWHYTFHDNRPQLAKWQRFARARKLGLWASSNPEMPWDWRKNNRDRRY